MRRRVASRDARRQPPGARRTARAASTPSLSRFSTADGLHRLAERAVRGRRRCSRAQPQLRRSLADPTTEPQRRAELVGRLVRRQGLGASCCSSSRDCGVAALVLAVGSARRARDHRRRRAARPRPSRPRSLDEVEDELFRFGRILDSDSRLTTLLDDCVGRRRPARRACSTAWSATRCTRSRRRLLQHAVTSQRKRSIIATRSTPARARRRRAATARWPASSPRSR